VAFSSSFGLEPGRFFGARNSPRSALFIDVALDRGEAHGEGAGRLGALDIPSSSTANTILHLRSTE
jgi:hypothetical protein